jgi:hypothetical protein
MADTSVGALPEADRHGTGTVQRTVDLTENEEQVREGKRRRVSVSWWARASGRQRTGETKIHSRNSKKKAFATSGEVRTHALNEDQNLSLAP